MTEWDECVTWLCGAQGGSSYAQNVKSSTEGSGEQGIFTLSAQSVIDVYSHT